MGVWIASLRLQPGESIVWDAVCNWVQLGRPIAGRFGLTSQALIFQPSRIEAVTGGEPRRIPLASITNATVEAAGATVKDLREGGLRRRMRLELVDGTVEHIAMNALEKRLQEVQEAVAAAR